MRVRARGQGRRALLPGVLGAALLAGLLGAGGCARAGAPAERTVPGPEQVRRAAATLAASGTSKVRTAMETASGGTRVTLEGAGVFDYVQRTGRLRVSLPPGASGARAGERRTVTEVLAPGALYMKNRGAGVPQGKWVRVGTEQAPDGNLVTAGATDPLVAAELLRGARGVTLRAVERRNGVRVWHFTGTAALARAVRAAPAGARKQLAAAERAFARTHVPFDAYLDGQGRLREVTHRFSYTGGEGTAGVPVSSTVRLHGFGTAVRVAAPARGEIYSGRVAHS